MAIVTTKFQQASEVRAHLKANGFDHRVNIRWGDNPFGGEGRFWVKPRGLEGTIASRGGSREPTRFFSDKPDTAKAYGELQRILQGTNASAA